MKKSTYFIQSALRVVCALALSPLASAHEPDIFIDDADSGNVEFVGSWATDPVTTNNFRATSMRTTGNTTNITEYARYFTTLPKTGPWKVYVWHNGRIGFCDEVQVDVKTAGGVVATTQMAQHYYGGYWLLLGTYWFDSAEQAEVKIHHNDSGYLSADVVRFSYAQPEVILDSTGDSYGITLYSAYTGNPATSTIGSAAWSSITSNRFCNEFNIRRSTTEGSAIAFTPSLPADGDYEVSVWMPKREGSWVIGSDAGAATVEVEVHSRAGVSTHTVTTPEENGAWVQVGTSPFRFGGAAPGQVVIKGPSVAGTTVPADAVRWTKVGTVAVYQDDEDPAGPPGVTLSVKTPGAPASWTTQLLADRLARRWSFYHYQPFGLQASRANNNDQRATYTPPLAEQGLYDIYVWYPWASENATTSRLSVHGAYAPGVTGPTVLDRDINQAVAGGNWLHAGRYVLKPNLAGQPAQTWVTLEPNANLAGKFTKADAVLFLRDGEDRDTDQDGLPDWQEIIIGTDTYDIFGNQVNANGGAFNGWDTDNDGMSDGDEYRLGFDPLVGAVVVSPSDIGLLRYTPLRPVNQ